MDDDALIDLILQTAYGLSPSAPGYATAKAAFKATAGANSAGQGRKFAEDIRQFNVGAGQSAQTIRNTREYQLGQLANSKRQTDNQYEIAKLGVKNDQERTALDRWKAEKDNEINLRRVAVEEGQLGVSRGAQGLDVLKTTVDLNSQVRNWAKALDWRRGVRANPDAPVFLRNLLSNAAASAGGNAPGMVAPVGLPEQNSLAAVLADLGVAGTAPGGGTMTGGGQAAPAVGAKPAPDPQQAGMQAMLKAYTPSATEGYDEKDINFLKGIASLAALGTSKTANRTAQLDTDEQQAIAGGMDRLGIGGDWWLRQQERQRVGNAASGAAA